jgi:putative N-acetyltransferase (TIGR04045 family)
VLDLVHPWGRPLPPPLSPRVSVSVAVDRWQLAAYHRLRREVFVDEQKLFERSDGDEHDACATPLVAVSEIAGMEDEVVGVVRIYPAEGTEEGAWHGGRLAVSRRYRRAGRIGSALIAAAVSSAKGHGCRRFLATVQLANVPYFERHGFRALGPVEVCGQPHLLMEAELARFPAAPGPGPSWARAA